MLTDTLLRDMNPFISDDSAEAKLYSDNSIYDRMSLSVANNLIAPFLRILALANLPINATKAMLNDDGKVTAE